jgi:hypothetical protein
MFDCSRGEDSGRACPVVLFIRRMSLKGLLERAVCPRESDYLIWGGGGSSTPTFPNPPSSKMGVLPPSLES